MTPCPIVQNICFACRLIPISLVSWKFSLLCEFSGAILRIIVKSPNSISFPEEAEPLQLKQSDWRGKEVEWEQHGSENGIGYQIHNTRNSFAVFLKRVLVD